MNRTHIGLIGAAVLGALTGCSGGPVDDPETATTSQNLTAGTMVSSLKLRASCVITEGGVDKMLVAGGETGAGVNSDDVEIYDPTSDTWDGAATDLPAAIANAKMVRVPGEDQCLFVGGEVGGVTSSDVYLYDRSANSWTQKADLNDGLADVPRENGALSICGTDTGGNSEFIYVGGDQGGTAKADILRYDLNANTWTLAESLKAARTKFGFASDDNNFDQFIVTGGTDGAARTDVELFQVTAAGCANMTDPVVAEDSNAAANINIVARFNHVTFRETVAGGAGEFVVALGENGTADVDLVSARLIDVSSFTAATNNATITNLSDLQTGRTKALAVPMIDGRTAIVGGVDLTPVAPALDAVENAVQFYKPSTNSFTGELDLITARSEFVGELLSSDGISIVGGGFDLTNALNQAESL